MTNYPKIEYRKMFDLEYLKNNPLWHAEDSLFKANWIKLFIDRSINIDKFKAADIGCGSGDIVNQLSQYYPSSYFFGFEISKTAYSICKKKTKISNVSFINGNILDFNPKHNHYDLLLCIDVIEHVEDHLSFLNRLREYSENFIFHIPLELSIQTIIRQKGITSFWNKYGHIHFFNRELAIHTLISCGYAVVNFQYTPSALVLPGRNLKSKLLKTPRMLLSMISKDFCAKVLGGYSLLVFCNKK